MSVIQLDINGRAYDATEVKIVGLGTEIRGVAGANYGWTVPHQNNHAIGSREPYNYSVGPKNYEPGELRLFLEEVAAIEDAFGGDKDITLGKPWDIIFTYLNDSAKVIVDQVTWKFSGWGREVNYENQGLVRAFPMHIIKIRPNIK